MAEEARSEVLQPPVPQDVQTTTLETTQVTATNPLRRADRGFTMKSLRSRISTWRIPEVGKDVPMYVQRAFRVKTFALLALQQGLCFTMMVLLRQLAWDGQPVKKSATVEGLYYLLSFGDMVMIMQLWLIRSSFPYNYLMMIVMTCVTAVLWSLTESVFATLLHMELVCMTCIAMGIASLGCCVLTREFFKCLSVHAVPIALFTGWLTASVGVVLVERLTPLEPSLKDWEPWLASVLLGLLLLLLMFEGRLALMRGQPDDFMGILIIMNGSMMSVVSVPFFVIIYGFLYMMREEDSDANSVRNTEEEEPQPYLDDVPHPLAVGEP